MEELVPVQIHQIDLTKTTQIGVMLPREAQENFEIFKQKNADVFAWSNEDMPGIDSQVIAH